MHRLVSTLTVIGLAASVLLITAPAEAGTRYVVTASVSTAKLDVGQSFTLKGRVTPSAKGQRVLVQRRSGSTWTTIKRARLNRYSRYRTTVKVTKPGDNAYRVVKPRSNGHPKGVSPTRVVTAWRWRSFVSLPLYTGPGSTLARTTHHSSGVLRGFSYAPFIRQTGAGGMANYGVETYRLDGKCTQLYTVVGATEDSDTNPSRAWLTGSHVTDPDNFSEVLLNAEVARGEDPLLVRRGHADIAGLASLEVSANSFVTVGNAVGWGNARVYCRS